MNNQQDKNNETKKRDDSFEDTDKTQRINVSSSAELNESDSLDNDHKDDKSSEGQGREKTRTPPQAREEKSRDGREIEQNDDDEDIDNPLEAIIINEDDDELIDQYYELIPDADADTVSADNTVSPNNIEEEVSRHQQELEHKDAAHKAELDSRESDFKEELRRRDLRIEQLEETLHKKTEEVQTYFDRLVRFQAEFENFKKRSYKEKKDFKKYCLEQIMLELLPNVDNLERGLESARNAEDIGPIIEGIEMIHRSFQNTLTKFGLQPIETEGQIFNPAHHEAMMTVDTTEHKNNMIIEEFQKGYILHERVIRPSLVSVAKHIAAVQEDSSEPEDQINEAMEEIAAQLKQKQNPEEARESESETTPPNDIDSGDTNNPTN